VKIVLLLIFIFSLFSCVSKDTGKKETNLLSLQEQYIAGHFITNAENNKLTVIGVSNRMLNRQDEINSAREDAAQKIAMYFGIHGKIVQSINANDNFFGNNNEISIELIYESNYERFINELTYDPAKDILITNEGLFIRFHYETNLSKLNYTVVFNNRRPTWTRNQDKQEIEGYITSIGFARNQQRLKDTIFKAIENAAIRMIEEQFTIISTTDVSITEQSSSSSSSSISSRSEGRINNFRIIEIWIEPGTRFVYVLAIGRVFE